MPLIRSEQWCSTHRSKSREDLKVVADCGTVFWRDLRVLGSTMRPQALLMRSAHYHPLPSPLRRLSPPSPPLLCSARPPFQSSHGIAAHPPAAAKLELQVSSPRPARRLQASPVSDAGSIDSLMIQAMEKKIQEQLTADVVAVKDVYGDGRHVSIDVVSSAFEGQSVVNRQRMVYKAIREEIQSTVHAVDQMTTRTPAEAEALNQ